MKKFKITTEQYTRLFSQKLSESADVRGGINRVNNTFKRAFKKGNVQKISEENFDINAPIAGIPKSRIKNTPEHEPINDVSENSSNPELNQAIEHFIKNIWLNPTQHSLSTYFVDNGIMWKDIIAFLAGKEIITQQGDVFRVNNVFKRAFSRDEKEAMQEKTEDIKKIVLQIEADPEAPWNKVPAMAAEKTNEPVKDVAEANPTPEAGNEEEVVQKYKGLVMNREIAIVEGNDGLYVFDYGDKLPNIEYEMEDLVEYLNNNIASISKGEGIKDFDSNTDLVKIDDALKNELIGLYNKDKKLVNALGKIAETTSAGSSGAFVGKMGAAPIKKASPANEIDDLIRDEEHIDDNEPAIEETTTTASSGQYVQPQIWAKNKANWKGAQKTQYPKGEMVSVGDNTIKTKRTKQSVISKTVYEAVAEKTGKSVDEVKRIIESRIKR